MACNLIVPIVRSAPPLRAQVRAAFDAGADLVELRVDLIGDVASVDALLREARTIPFILTVRAREEGGAWDGDEAERIALIERLGLLLPGYIDIEHETWMRSANVRQKIGLVCATSVDESSGRPKNKLILSHHDLLGTPGGDRLAERVIEMRKQPACVIKVVYTPRDAIDALRILGLKQAAAGNRPLIALGLGEAGLATRVLAGNLGLFGSFAALDAEGQSAAGQPTIEELRTLYRWDSLSTTTRRFGVIGWPISHSSSPRIHNAAMARDGIDGVYVPLPVSPAEEAFSEFMDLQRQRDMPSFAGFSVTLPHKEHALRWLLRSGFEANDRAWRCGAVNTLVRRSDWDWYGDNTDGIGAWAALTAAAPELAVNPAGAVVLVLGAGGAARGIVAELLEQGCRVCVANRTDARASALSAELGCTAVAWDDRTGQPVNVIVNCTSVGMTPKNDASPFPAASLRAVQIVLDTVYTPPRTQLLRDAEAAGCRVISGREMFLGQASEQYRLWHGRAAPIDAMRAALA